MVLLTTPDEVFVLLGMGRGFGFEGLVVVGEVAGVLLLWARAIALEEVAMREGNVVVEEATLGISSSMSLSK